MLVSLYTSRVILDALGIDDYGIYNVVGGFVAMFALISSSLTSACTRFINYEMGKSDIERQQKVFSTIVIIQWSLAIIVFFLSEAVGIWYVNNVMVLPEERLFAANWCFQFSVFNFCTNLITVPYTASIIAHEKMKAFAFVSLYDGIGRLVISFLVFLEPFDRLVFYALLLLILQLSVRVCYQFYCKKHFAQSSFVRVFDKPLLKEVLGYSLWHLIGNGASVLKTHGVNVLLNLFYGPVVNAAKGIANQVDQAVQQFSSNFMLALNPQITQSYARGDYSYMIQLVSKGSRFSFYVILLISLPIILNAEFLLNIWLKEVPDYAVIFTQLSLISMLISSLSKTLITAQNATGNVRNYQIAVGGVLLLNLPLCYVFLQLGFPPSSVVIIAMVVELLASVVRLYMLPSTLVFFKPYKYIKDVFFNCLFVVIMALPIPLYVQYNLPHNIIGFVVNTSLCLLFTVLSVGCFGCSKSERTLVSTKIRSLCKR